jgi:hypothetical protein
MADTLPVWPQNNGLIREVDSRAIDQIQAADIAAGWARELAAHPEWPKRDVVGHGSAIH